MATRRSRKAGLPPGTLVHVGERKREKTRVTILDYDESGVREQEAQSLDDCLAYRDQPTVTWIDVSGLHQVEVLDKLGAGFGLHPLVLEDILNTDQRPKMQDYGDYTYVVVRMLSYDDPRSRVVGEQVSLLLGPRFVISFQEDGGDVFGPIRERIRSGTGRIRKMGTDYLTYALLDAIVDAYFGIVEKLGDRVEALEEELLKSATPASLRATHALRREMLLLRKSVWPLREVISGLERGESALVKESTVIYLRDVYDHTVEMMDTIETLREMLTDMLDIYLSSVNNRLSEVVKVLTLFSTIFMPLTFIAGVYGMNFEHMPELRSPWGYPAALAVMATIAASMLLYYKRRKWF